ncbi:MAG: hypothetical protein AAGU32_21145, partial [Bacillota bacterium]
MLFGTGLGRPGKQPFRGCAVSPVPRPLTRRRDDKEEKGAQAMKPQGGYATISTRRAKVSVITT